MRYKKCSLKFTCDALSERVTDMSGIVSWNIINVTTGKRKPSLIGYKANRKDKGLVFNYCPWCGYDMSKRIAAVEDRP